MRERLIDVVVVGAGPAGSAAAARLAAAGCSVWLLERCRLPRPKPCGEFVNPGAARELRALGAWPWVERAGPLLHRRWRLVSRAGSVFEIDDAELGTAETPAFVLPRERFDTALVEHAVHRGTRLREGWNVRGPLRDARGRVTGVQVRDDAGRERELRAGLVLAADGPRSRLARQLGLTAPQQWPARFGLAARFETPRAPAEPCLEMHAGPAGACCGLAWHAPGLAHLALVVPASELPRLRGRPAAYLWEALAHYPLLRETLAAARPRGSVRTCGPIGWRTRRQACPGLLLVGDAAGFYDPFTGQGITFALQTARLAAEAALAALAPAAADRAALRAYERRRAALLGPKVALQRAIQAVLARPVLAERCWERLHARPGVAARLLAATGDVADPRSLLHPAFALGLSV